MNILVTGANGQLGTEIRNLGSIGAHRFVFTDVNSLPGVETIYLDITDKEAIRALADLEDVDVIINCAAFTDVAGAEDRAALADMLNHTAVANLAAVAAERGAIMVQVSTDYVFGGDASVPYREDDPKSPLGVYGRTKLKGEEAVTSSGCQYLIFRTAWLYSPYGKNFVKTIRTLSSEKPQLKVVFDQIGTPTYAADLAGAILEAVGSYEPAMRGIYHYSNEGAISWYDFAKAICQLSGNVCDIEPCHSDEFPSKAERPHYSVLDKTKIKKTFGIGIPYWRDSLEDCIKRLQ